MQTGRQIKQPDAEEDTASMETVRILPEHLGRWQQSLADDGRDVKTIRLYRTTVSGFLDWQGGGELSRVQLHAYVRHLQTDHQTPGAEHTGLRPRTIRRTFTAMRSFWRYMKTQGVDLPALDSITLPRLDTAQRRVPSDTEVRAIFAAAERIGNEARSAHWRDWLRHRARAVLALLAGCALRRGELLALNETDLRELPTGWVVVVRRGKMGQARTIPVAEEHIGALKAWLRVRRERMQRLDHDALPLFHEDKGGRMGQHSLDSLWDAILRGAGLEDTGLTPHGLRHWAATSIIRRSSVKVAQAYLGHASPSTTLSVYAHADADDLRLAASGLAGTIHTPVEQAQKVSRAEAVTPTRSPGKRLRRSAKHMLGR
jgi:integrase